MNQFWDSPAAKLALSNILNERFYLLHKSHHQALWLMMHIALDILIYMQEQPLLLRQQQHHAIPTLEQIRTVLQSMQHRFQQIFDDDDEEYWYMHTSPDIIPIELGIAEPAFWTTWTAITTLKNMICQQRQELQEPLPTLDLMESVRLRLWLQPIVRNTHHLPSLPKLNEIRVALNLLLQQESQRRRPLTWEEEEL